VYPPDLRYTKEHEWVRVLGGKALVGITEYAEKQLGDVVYVDLPKAGSPVHQFDTFGVIESVKAASDLYSPVSGTVARANGKLSSNPELVNSDAYGEGWLIEVDLSDPAEVGGLLNAQQYVDSLPKD
jgi:glycine cleavage system H protein